MELIFEELDYQETPKGAISLRRRSEPRLNNLLIYEVKLNDEWLMSSLFVEAEEQLSVLGIEYLKQNGFTENLSLVVGGLGLGYTSAKALEDQSVAELNTIEIMPAVIKWHQQGLLPIGKKLSDDHRSQLVNMDFFEFALSDTDDVLNGQQVHGILLDIDHSPSHWLNSENQKFYRYESLKTMATKIIDGGVFGLWSNEPPDQAFLGLLSQVFNTAEAHVIEFPNPYSGTTSINSVYICGK